MKRKRFTVDVESLPLDLRRLIEAESQAAARAAGADEGWAVEVSFVVRYYDGNPEPRWTGPGLLREEVLS